MRRFSNEGSHFGTVLIRRSNRSNTICKGGCSVNGCDRQANAASLCGMHYKRRAEGSPLPDA
jgi:hypothetical protein